MSIFPRFIHTGILSEEEELSAKRDGLNKFFSETFPRELQRLSVLLSEDDFPPYRPSAVLGNRDDPKILLDVMRAKMQYCMIEVGGYSGRGDGCFLGGQIDRLYADIDIFRQCAYDEMLRRQANTSITQEQTHDDHPSDAS